ncbi:MAG: PIN domain-containing protein [Anaerolineae bacterium]|nr:PIN domain-containing protein [Anaerolineae bacterium]
MTVGLVDTTVIIHSFHKNPAAQAWVDTQATRLSITPITWLEVMYGAGSKVKQAACKAILDRFEMIYLTQADQMWAMGHLARYRLSHGIGMNDCLIAAVAHRLQVPLYTHNLKDMTPLVGSLAIKPYRS